jgi:hypothetical protein
MYPFSLNIIDLISFFLTIYVFVFFLILSFNIKFAKDNIS